MKGSEIVLRIANYGDLKTLEKCFSKNSIHSILVDPLAKNLRAHKFYERFGFKFLENRRFGLDDCKVYLLTREDWRRNER
ncbi:GNAT family acetyltransferase [Leptospira venezuelensis]|uniref:GNAT family acetyltransferase n=1 Tax=Leptospira venezuelensis TaxID=1958811 RepID=UPI0018F8AFA6|nr:GNAT family acetyltransferase [Leptospira venezuelensis]